MKKFFFKFLFSFLLISSFSTSSYATHIIGGDFKVTMTNNGTSSSVYDIQLRLYRDDVNGAVNMPASVTIGIYQIGTNNLQTIKTLYLDNGSGSLVPLGDPCYTPNPSIVRIEEGVYNGLGSVSLPNFSMGYYLHYETCCRNGLIDNLATPTSDGISIFAIIPDPSLGQNSTPDFGDYPNDAYFCVNNIKYFTWPVTDPDGDSLVFSLVAPLNDGTNTNNGNSAPGSGAYPFYPSCNFAPGFNQFNVIGGTPQMSINPVTGEMAASPAILGYFQFSVRVEEYRNGVKIGEVRRDAQYASLPCVLANPPVITVNDDIGSPLSDTFSVDVYVNDSICFDLEVGVNDPSDSVFLKLTSSNFDLLNSFIPASNYISGGTNLAYYDWDNNIGDTVFFNQYSPNSAGYIGNTGVLYMRYCWEAPCEGIDSTFNVTMDSYSIDCSGFNPVQKELSIYVQKIPAPTFLDIPSTINVTLDDTICIDLFAQDTLNADDTLAIEPYSANFSFDSTFVPPQFNNSTGQYYYDDFNDSIGNTISMIGYSHVGNVSSAIQNVALRFCWVTDCNYVYQKEFDLNYRAFSTVCGSDTVTATSNVTVDPPTGDVKEIPNIFTPNGDGNNDVYKLAGTNDPCYDVMQINIYNRWGQLVFKSFDPNFHWDGNSESGKECKPGAYLVIMNGTFGSTYDADGNRTSNPVRDEFWVHLLK
ncbi:MAG: gliding motility-associated C-terminal domain-containing protein [Flavobacteriales bacterium]